MEADQMYGDAFEKFPIQTGEMFKATMDFGNGTMQTHKYICAPFSPKAMDMLMGEEKVDLIYTDPPWDTRIANQFRQWVGLDKLPKGGFENILEGIAAMAKKYSSKYVAIEMGMRGMEDLVKRLKKYGGIQLEMFFPTYGGTNTEYCLWFGTFIEGVESPVWDESPNGKNSEKNLYIPNFLARNCKPKRVLDMFVGAASFWPPFVDAGADCFGLEFNKRKIANVTKYFYNKGYDITKISGE